MKKARTDKPDRFKLIEGVRPLRYWVAPPLNYSVSSTLPTGNMLVKPKESQAQAQVQGEGQDQGQGQGQGQAQAQAQVQGEGQGQGQGEGQGRGKKRKTDDRDDAPGVCESVCVYVG